MTVDLRRIAAFASSQPAHIVALSATKCGWTVLNPFDGGIGAGSYGGASLA